MATRSVGFGCYCRAHGGGAHPDPRDLVMDCLQSVTNTMSARDERIRRFIQDPPVGLTRTANAVCRSIPAPGA